MLTVSSDSWTKDCEGHSRRDFLKVGALGLGGLTLPALLQAQAQASEAGSHIRNKSVVFLFLHGGASQIETWDPKMTAPSNIRSYTGEVQTKLPGVTFGGTFPRLAAMADKLAIVRSFRVGTGSHGTGRRLVATAGNDLEAPLGSIFARIAGTTHPTTGMPTNIALPPSSAGAEYNGLDGRIDMLENTGKLAREFRPFVPSSGPAAAANNNRRRRGRPAPSGGLLSDMQLRVPADRLDDRRALLQQLSELQQHVDQHEVAAELGQYRQQAYNVILRGVSQAFDLSQEDPRVLARYDTSDLRIPQSVLNKGSRNARKIPQFEPTALGKQLLMARRLCEAGCGFVTVTSHGWDMHGNALGINDGFPCLGPALDKAVSGFLEDLESRGLSDDILLVITGEMGRTPRINNKAGRDHWANLCSLALAGGGLKMGQVIGASDRNAGTPATTPVTLDNLLATVMHTLFDVGQLRVTRGLPTEVVRMINSAQPIRELFA
ncbi:MAG: DUF1501 domain-containing protein [Gemmataceae bacterium]